MTGTKAGQEDVKKLICLSFRDFIFDHKCLPIAQRSLIRHPRAIFLRRVHCKFENLFFHIFQTERNRYKFAPATEAFSGVFSGTN
jgi:hypothetical protein